MRWSNRNHLFSHWNSVMAVTDWQWAGFRMKYSIRVFIMGTLFLFLCPFFYFMRWFIYITKDPERRKQRWISVMQCTKHAQCKDGCSAKQQRIYNAFVSAGLSHQDDPVCLGPTISQLSRNMNKRSTICRLSGERKHLRRARVRMALSRT